MSDQTNEPAASEDADGFGFLTPFVQQNEALTKQRQIFLASGLSLAAAGAYGQLPIIVIRNFGVDDGDGTIRRKPEYDGLTKEVVEQAEFYGDHEDCTSLVLGSTENVLTLVALIAKSLSQSVADIAEDNHTGEKMIIGYLMQQAGLSPVDLMLDAFQEPELVEGDEAPAEAAE